MDATEWLEWYTQLFGAVVGIASLGAGFVFTIIFSGIEAPVHSADPDTAKEYIRTCLAAAWLLFVAAIGWTTFVALLMSVNKNSILEKINAANTENKKWGSDSGLLLLSWSTLVAQLLPIGGFLASAEALRKYHNAIGTVSLVATSLAAGIVVLVWFWQNV